MTKYYGQAVVVFDGDKAGASTKDSMHASSIETSDNHHISYAYLSHVKQMPMCQNTGL